MPTPPYIDGAYLQLSRYYSRFVVSNKVHPQQKPYFLQMAVSAEIVRRHLGILFEGIVNVNATLEELIKEVNSELQSKSGFNGSASRNVSAGTLSENMRNMLHHPYMPTIKGYTLKNSGRILRS